MGFAENHVLNAETIGLREAVEAIGKAKSILITTHINPDGDAIGSALGLMHILRSTGKNVEVVNQDGAGSRYLFLPGAESIKTEPGSAYDLGIAVDCGGPNRVGRIRESLMNCPVVMRIDHHPVGESFGHIEYLDFEAAAVGEMIAELADEMQLEIVSEAGICLLASLVEDTGCFQFSSVSPRTFRICGELVEAGADLHWVVQQIYWKRSPGTQRMTARCIENMVLESDGRIAWTIASMDDFAHFNTTHEDVDEVVHTMLTTDGVEVSVLLRESENDYRVSLRSRDYVDVASLASEFGGGGHMKAAGCRVAKDQQSIRRLVEAAASRL